MVMMFQFKPLLLLRAKVETNRVYCFCNSKRVQSKS